MIERPLPLIEHFRAYLRAKKHAKLGPILEAGAEEALRQVAARVRTKRLEFARKKRAR